MIDSVRSRFPKPLYALIGGIHLYDAAPERRDAVVHQLIAQDIPLLGVSHCTGDEASAILKERFPGYFANMAGTVTTII
jgi:7,8-dihydropterin-6-yl-methyl-4-(beta-D-ribofuranosyl)aminobenzene 5'-phosphate synthase